MRICRSHPYLYLIGDFNCLLAKKNGEKIFKSFSPCIVHLHLFYCRFTVIPAFIQRPGICTNPVSTYSVSVILEASTKHPTIFILL